LSESAQIMIVQVFRRDDFLKVATIPTGSFGMGCGGSGDGSRIYAGLENDDDMVAIETATNLLRERMQADTSPLFFDTADQSPRTSTLSALSLSCARSSTALSGRKSTSLQFRLW